MRAGDQPPALRPGTGPSGEGFADLAQVAPGAVLLAYLEQVFKLVLRGLPLAADSEVEAVHGSHLVTAQYRRGLKGGEGKHSGAGEGEGQYWFGC